MHVGGLHEGVHGGHRVRQAHHSRTPLPKQHYLKTLRFLNKFKASQPYTPTQTTVLESNEPFNKFKAHHSLTPLPKQHYLKTMRLLIKYKMT
jgi:hypothetical protein